MATIPAEYGTRLELPRLPVLGFDVLRTGGASQIGSVLQRGEPLLTTSARAALLQALRILGIGKGDRVLVPTYHCPTMISPVIRVGAVPLYYPLTRSGLPSQVWLERADTSRVKALLAAHFFGLPLSMDGLRRFCDERGLYLIEDCAHAFFGETSGRVVGSLGDVALASLPKFFPVNEGGCLLGAPALLARVVLSSPPIASEARSALDPLELGARFGRFGILSPVLRGLFRLKDAVRGRRPAQAAVDDGDAPQWFSYEADPWLDEERVERRMTHVTEWLMRHADHEALVARRRHNYSLLSQLFSDVEGARPLFPDLPAGAAPYVFPLEVGRPDPLYAAVRAAGVPVFRWDRLWPDTPRIEGDHGTAWSKTVFQIGCHQDLREDEVRRVAAVLRGLIGRTAE